ncbi:hypothetical protein B4U80_13369 [Leptotrombidium deliense]|uniref:Major facilitator superfamily associated domain-containing protein n=1 Tax=Leptotrombidium deliense TaxID=299467 RepID=A0A443S7I0_9ACAR|nr:hypothetical protein B4U80_13369 [Leptotrombidium deliense]
MPIQLSEIGLTDLESGIIYTVLPILNLIIPPSFGMIVEKFGHHKIVNLICIIGITISCILICNIPVKDEAEGKNMFWIYLFLRISFSSFQISIQVMFQSSIAVIAKNKGGYGKQRIWSLVATMIFNPLTGILMTVCTKNNEAINYKPAFYLFIFFMIPLFIFVCLLKFEITKREEEQRKPVKQFLKSARLWFFYSLVVLVGVLQSVRIPYFIMFYRELNGPPYLIGILRSVTSLANIPVAYFASQMARKIGFYVYIIFILLLALRYVLLSVIYDPWLTIPIYALIPSGNIIVVANVEFSMILAPPGYFMTFVALASNANLGVGRILGRLLSAFIWTDFGARTLFHIIAAIAVGTSLFSAIIYSIYKPLRRNGNIVDDFDGESENRRLINDDESPQSTSVSSTSSS